MKNYMKIPIFLLCIIAVIACQPNQEQTTSFKVSATECALRTSPSVASAILDSLEMGEAIQYMSEMTDTVTGMYIDEVWHFDPWIKVKTAQGRVGWVNIGQLKAEDLTKSDLYSQLVLTRCGALFGDTLRAHMVKYQQQYKSAKTSQEVAAIYQDGSALRDTLLHVLSRKILIEEPSQAPDLLWIEDIMPGFVLHLVAEGTSYYLFWDYKQLDALSKKTTGPEDDAFVQLCYHAYSIDSIENFFPSWLIQTTDYEGYSLLGQGIHRRLFSEIDTLLHKSAVFQAPISGFQRALLNDITNTTVAYWEPAIKIIGEMEAIVKADYVLFKPKDRVAISARRKMFDNPEKFKILVNLRGGVPQE